MLSEQFCALSLSHRKCSWVDDDVQGSVDAVLLIELAQPNLSWKDFLRFLCKRFSKDEVEFYSFRLFSIVWSYFDGFGLLVIFSERIKSHNRAVSNS